jgi:hypothetical protein
MTTAVWPRRSRRRTAVHVVIVALIAGLGIVAAPTAASAGTFGPDIPCPNDPNIVWNLRQASRHVVVHEGFQYTVLSATPVFNVSDTRIVENGTAGDISATFMSQQSRSYSVTVTVGTTAQLVDKLQSTVSVAIVQQRTSSLGVTATLTVPARSRIIGDYGVEAYNVVYNVQTVWMRLDRGQCWDRGTSNGNTTNAPTLAEGWRFTTQQL